jgi:pyruvate dehydrogenase E2 component (dihydrolipoamide acetyltransferase)
MATPIVMPRLGDFMTEGVVSKFSKSLGDKVDQGEVIAEIETEKVNYDLEATVSGTFHPVVEAGATVAVDAIMGYLLEEGEPPPAIEENSESNSLSDSKTRPQRASGRVSTQSGAPIPSTPGARKLAAKLGVDISKVTATGPRGRIVEADIRSFSETENNSGIPVGLPEPSEVLPLTGMRKAIAANMKASLSGSAQLSYFLEVDVTEAQRQRRDAGVTLGALLIKAASEALAKVPNLNSVLADDTVYRFNEVNIAFAVSLDDGLVVPVIRDVGEKNVSEISDEMAALSDQARAGIIKPDQLIGGTFTVSILGSVDGFTPILNQGQVALLGVGRSVQKPVVKNREIIVREMMVLSLTGDHQVIDGAVAASFFRRLQQQIERPTGLIN